MAEFQNLVQFLAGLFWRHFSCRHGGANFSNNFIEKTRRCLVAIALYSWSIAGGIITLLSSHEAGVCEQGKTASDEAGNENPGQEFMHDFILVEN